jgi:gas vesicle protein
MIYSGLAGALLGAATGAVFAYFLQKKLLKEQLSFQKNLHEESLAFQKSQGELDAEIKDKISKETLAAIHDASQHVKYAISHASRQPSPDQ